jgi:hypothetical protein
MQVTVKSSAVGGKERKKGRKRKGKKDEKGQKASGIGASIHLEPWPQFLPTLLHLPVHPVHPNQLPLSHAH